jgi:hypothetical protein
MVSTEFRGGAASRLLRGSLVATLPGLSYQHTSAETLGQDTVEGAGKEALNSSSWRGTTFSGAASVGERHAGVTFTTTSVVVRECVALRRALPRLVATLLGWRDWDSSCCCDRIT